MALATGRVPGDARPRPGSSARGSRPAPGRGRSRCAGRPEMVDRLAVGGGCPRGRVRCPAGALDDPALVRDRRSEHPVCRTAPRGPSRPAADHRRARLAQQAQARVGFRVVVPDAGARGPRRDLRRPLHCRRGHPSVRTAPGGGGAAHRGRRRAERGVRAEARPSAAGTSRRCRRRKAALWIAGAPHEFLFVGRNGATVSAPLRLDKNMLLWQRGDVLFRLEGDFTLAEALRVARSILEAGQSLERVRGTPNGERVPRTEGVTRSRDRVPRRGIAVPPGAAYNETRGGGSRLRRPLAAA